MEVVREVVERSGLVGEARGGDGGRAGWQEEWNGCPLASTNERCDPDASASLHLPHAKQAAWNVLPLVGSVTAVAAPIDSKQPAHATSAASSTTSSVPETPSTSSASSLIDVTMLLYHFGGGAHSL